MLATLIMAPDQLFLKEIGRMAKQVTYYNWLDELVDDVLVRSAHADDLRDRWLDSPEELTGRAGWRHLIANILESSAVEADLDATLRKIEAEILSAPKRKQETMNRCLVAIGIHYLNFRIKCVKLGERLGKFDEKPAPKGCISSYAPEWIAAVLKRKNA